MKLLDTLHIWGILAAILICLMNHLGGIRKIQRAEFCYEHPNAIVKTGIFNIDECDCEKWLNENTNFEFLSR